MDERLSRRSFVKLAGCTLAGALASGALVASASEQAASSAADAKAASAQADAATHELTYDADGNRIVVDSGGTEVVCPADLASVMTFGSCGVINTLIETLGCGGLIANNMSPRFTSNEWQYRFAPQMAEEEQYENQAGEIDYEGVVAAAPDLCIVMQSATAETLRSNGLNTLYVDYGSGRDSSAVSNAITILGDALGVPEKAEEYNAYLDEMVEKIADVTSAISDDEKLKVLYGNVAAFTNPHILSEWFIPAAGGISCTSEIHTEATCTYTAEDLLEWNPDVIIMITDNSEELAANDQINSVTAIANGNMFTCPTVGHFITGSSEVPIGILWVANKLYPDLYAEEDLREDISYFYSTFFDYEMTDEEIDSIVNY